MHPTTPKLLEDMAVAGDLIAEHLVGRSLADYEHDPLLRAGVERCCEIIGEALRRIERRDPGAVALIPGYHDLIDLREALDHGYDTVEHADVWRFVNEELPLLRDRVAALLHEAEDA